MKSIILKHIKTGGYYYQLNPELDWRKEADMSEMFAYQPLRPNAQTENMVFLRPISELSDGRYSNIGPIDIYNNDAEIVKLIRLMTKTYRARLYLISVVLIILFYALGFYMGKLV